MLEQYHTPMIISFKRKSYPCSSSSVPDSPCRSDCICRTVSVLLYARWLLRSPSALDHSNSLWLWSADLCAIWIPHGRQTVSVLESIWNRPGITSYPSIFPFFSFLPPFAAVSSNTKNNLFFAIFEEPSYGSSRVVDLHESVGLV